MSSNKDIVDLDTSNMSSDDDIEDVDSSNDTTQDGTVQTQALNKKKKKRKRKKKKKTNKPNPNDSVQIIDEITRCSQPVEIIGEQNRDTSTNDSSYCAIVSESGNRLQSSATLSTNKLQSGPTISTNRMYPTDQSVPANRQKSDDFISFSNGPKGVSANHNESYKGTSSHYSSDTNNKTEDFGDIFQIDTAPSDVQDNYNSVPRYISKFSESALSEEKVAVKKSWRPTALCFNCDGEHSIRDCTKPRNQQNINRNRNAFMAKKQQQMGNVNASRYHLDHHQKFAHIKPGTISKQLRKALNLSSDQLPLHTYRMRLVGYPPAWLEEAKVKHSGISVFDSSGQALADPDDEDGEVEMDRCKYDIKKIIDFPGFNVRPPKGTLNESNYLRFPDMIPDQSKDRMMSYLSPRAAVPYKKRKLDDKDLPQEGESGQNRTLRQSMDMDVDEVPETLFEPPGECAFIPALPNEPPAPRPPPPPPIDLPPPPPGTEEEEEEEGEIKSDESEEEKEEGKGVKRKREGDGGEEEKQISKKRVSTSDPAVNSTPPPSASSAGSGPNTGVSPLHKSGSVPNLGSIKTVDLGTPIINHAVSADRLPSHEAFAKDICDVINFDNLPDSTGKYKVLRKVVKKVRGFMTKLTNGGAGKS
uniref:Zinc finger CCHC domain-containing protein 8 homolog n=1 Tax=Cacopsylla melanoneura TaxID=428564 RepID=A0A8D9ALY1_9HEMI